MTLSVVCPWRARMRVSRTVTAGHGASGHGSLPILARPRSQRRVPVCYWARITARVHACVLCACSARREARSASARPPRCWDLTPKRPPRYSLQSARSVPVLGIVVTTEHAPAHMPPLALAATASAAHSVGWLLRTEFTCPRANTVCAPCSNAFCKATRAVMCRLSACWRRC